MLLNMFFLRKNLDYLTVKVQCTYNAFKINDVVSILDEKK